VLALAVQLRCFKNRNECLGLLLRVACFGKIHGMTSTPDLAQMTPDQLRAFAAQLLSQVETMGHTVDTMSKKEDQPRSNGDREADPRDRTAQALQLAPATAEKKQKPSVRLCRQSFHAR